MNLLTALYNNASTEDVKNLIEAGDLIAGVEPHKLSYAYLQQFFAQALQATSQTGNLEHLKLILSYGVVWTEEAADVVGAAAKVKDNALWLLTLLPLIGTEQNSAEFYEQLHHVINYADIDLMPALMEKGLSNRDHFRVHFLIEALCIHGQLDKIKLLAGYEPGIEIDYVNMFNRGAENQCFSICDYARRQIRQPLWPDAEESIFSALGIFGNAKILDYYQNHFDMTERALSMALRNSILSGNQDFIALLYEAGARLYPQDKKVKKEAIQARQTLWEDISFSDNAQDIILALIEQAARYEDKPSLYVDRKGDISEKELRLHYLKNEFSDNQQEDWVRLVEQFTFQHRLNANLPEKSTQKKAKI